MPLRESLRQVPTRHGVVTVRVRRNRRARRLTMRIDAQDGTVAVTIPFWAPAAEADAMVEARADWIRDCLAKMGPRIPFVPGAIIPVAGSDRLLVQRPGVRGRVELTDETLIVPGDDAHFARRVGDWLKAEARRRLETTADSLAAEHGLRRGRITVRDTKSRWGSCAHDGRLSFSWRLILAPSFVLTYVVAHELAHLREANHGPAFWAFCDSLTPDRDAADAWLAEHGGRLHRYGVPL